ncbi:MAG: ATP-dependent 6-phosphofructokinase [Gemmatimonadetes bacterium]|nr:ATP-dependent 6-phosphofructokinase [Gemmatimonadota bacterium]
MNQTIRRIAINTGGGDAPGLNAVIRAAVLSALQRGWECLGIRDGYNGLLAPETYPDGGVVELTRDSVRGITHLGGTILGTTNRGSPLAYPTLGGDGQWYERDRSDELVAKLKELNVDALIAIGGDGSLAIANALFHKGVRVVGVPKTIDNDLAETVVTFGFDSAVSFAAEAVDRLHTTAEAHDRVMVVEVMGRYAGWIALHAGVAGTADAILIPEIPYDIEKVADRIRERAERGRDFAIVVVAEGAHAIGGERSVVAKEVGQQERLGGIGHRVAEQIEDLTAKETRTVVLGHLLRGGSPTTRDRILALRFGSAAVRALADGCFGCMVALDPPIVRYVPLSSAIKRMKTVPLDSDTMCTARELGISFGD